MESYFKALTLWLASGSEAAAALVIGLATIEATLRALWLFVQGAFPQVGIREHQDDKERVRLRLGRWLAVALEFELAADVLRTAVAPTWDEIGQLAAIIVLRTLLNYFLQKEIDKAEARDALRMSARRARPEGGRRGRDLRQRFRSGLVSGMRPRRADLCLRSRAGADRRTGGYSANGRRSTSSCRSSSGRT